MEDSSHELIEQLIAEEKYCYGFEGVPVENVVKDMRKAPLENPFMRTNSSVAEAESNLQGEKRVSPVSSSQTLLSHNKRWSAEEDELLIHCVKLYGYGKWKTIAEHIKTRNALQCKNRARQKKELQEFNSTTRKNSGSSTDAQNEDDSDTEVSTQNNLIPIPSLLEPTTPTTVFFQSPVNTSAAPMTPLPEVYAPTKEESSEQQQITPEQEETVVNPDEITEDEKSANREWFMGKPVKTPERYMRIRNHILHCWKMNKPNYLTKTAGRKNLKDCGDVNAVGRIHGYLESIGAINVNCVPTTNKRKGRRFSEASSTENREPKKRKKGPGYYWADVDSEEDEQEGAHPKTNIIAGDGKSRPKRTANKRETFYDENRIDYGMSDDPFRLIPVVYYPKQYHAPFTVNVTSDVLLVMEFHSHLAYTEIIGLLGGRIRHDQEGRKVLLVEYVFPCRSASTGIQCEMDPVSEMAARELFEQKGLQVVGWYHSHPTFDPEPSIRDIENQSSYQDLFRDEISGIEPFIGIIITPYNSSTFAEKSQFQFIHISNRWSSNNQYRLPFACIHSVSQCQSVSPDVLQIFQDLLFQYRSYEHKIDMKLPYGSMTRLEKLLRSLKNHLFMGLEENKKFLIHVNHMIQNIYIGGPIQTGFNANQQDADFSQNVDKMVHSLAI